MTSSASRLAGGSIRGFFVLDPPSSLLDRDLVSDPVTLGTSELSKNIEISLKTSTYKGSSLRITTMV